MSEATSTAAGIALGTSGASVPTGAGAVQVATVFFIAMGLQPELLFAGMWGALASIVLFGSIPLEENTWQGRVVQTFQRLMVVVVSAVMAGYAAPIVGELIAAPLRAILNISATKCIVFSAFVIGAGGQVSLRSFISRYAKTFEHSPTHQPTTHAGK